MQGSVVRVLGAGLLGILSACGAVYPELKTPVRVPTQGQPLEPPPEPELYYFYFERATIPSKTRDGRDWVPSSFARLLIDDREILTTPVDPKNRKPTWPGQKKANYYIGSEQKVVIEVWDEGPINDVPVCSSRVLNLRNMAEGGRSQIDCESGASVWLAVAPARPIVGLGLYYELRGADGVRVSRVAPRSPTARAGLLPGELILSVQGQSVAGMDALVLRSKINLNARSGLELEVAALDGARRKISLKEGPIYPLDGEDLRLLD